MPIFSGLRVPVIAAPMAGGINNPEMVAAVIKSGGIGSFGFAYSSPQKIEEDLIATMNLCGGDSSSINANFFIFQKLTVPSQGDINRAQTVLKNLPGIKTINIPVPTVPFYPELDEQLEPIWQIKPKYLTFHFGLPKQSIIKKAHELGILVGVTATSEDEAKQIEHAGADFIVAQGIEAGGHRGIFDIDGGDERLPAKDLLLRLKPSIKLPIVVAGGIMTPQDVKIAIEAGANAVQMGSAFVTLKESSASPAHKRYLLSEHARGVAFTKGFSGRWAQGINNSFMVEMSGQFVMPFPLQNTMTSSIRQEAVKLDDGEYQSLWCGSRYSLCMDMSVHEFMAAIEKELGR